MVKSQYRAAVLTVSDKGSQGKREDLSGPAVQKLLEEFNYCCVDYTIVADELQLIREQLIFWSDIKKIDLIITTGGTGLSPRDVTPEATQAILELELLGIPEAMRMASFQKIKSGILSRGVAGCRNKSLITNLPGSERGAVDNLKVVLPCLEHAIYKYQGGTKDCGSIS